MIAEQAADMRAATYDGISEGLRAAADGNLFVTEKLGTVPLKLPEGVDRPKYMAYKQLAKQAMPGRLREGKGER